MKRFEEISPTFCVLPWIHLASTPNGKSKVCCISNRDLHDENGRLFSFETDKIADIWNSPEMLRTREQMLKGEKVKACAQCYSEEALGGHSMRIGFNEKWYLQENAAVLERVEQSIRDHHRLASMPWYYDLRQGNLCNLKCRSCAPENSVSIEKEYLKISEKNPWFAEQIGGRVLEASYRDWFNNESFNAQLLAEIPNIKKLYFTGGEPTLIEKNFELLEKCVELGRASQIELMFNTNLTNLSDRFIGLIQKFRYVMLNLSIEGFGPEQEYLRGNSKWEVIEKNLNKLAQNHTHNVHLLLTPVMQASNVLTVDRLFLFIEELNQKYKKNLFHFMPIILTDPAHLEMSILPAATRREAAERLKAYLRASKITAYDRFFETRLRQVISKLEEEAENRPELVSKFIRFTKTLDESRNQSFQRTFPELFASWSRHAADFDWNRA